MAGILQGIIPDTIDDVIDSWKQEGSGQYRLTLLHRSETSMYCFLSGSLQEFRAGQKIDVGTIIILSKKSKLHVHYDINLHQRDIPGGHYFVLEDDNPLDQSKRVIPFRYERELPSVIVEKTLKETLFECMILKGELDLQLLEMIGSHNIVKAVSMRLYDKEIKKRRDDLKEMGKAIKKDITPLFHEEQSPSSVINPNQYLEEDKGKTTMFVRRPIIPTVLSILGLSMMPYSSINIALKGCMSKHAEKRFGQSKEQEAMAWISDFLYSHPKAANGMEKLAEIAKHAGNMGLYGLLVGAAALARSYTWPILSYPMIAWTGASGATMLYNFVRSGARDSSGIISTVCDRRYFNRLE